MEIFISDWIRIRNTVEFWVFGRVYNPQFKYGEYALETKQD